MPALQHIAKGEGGHPPDMAASAARVHKLLTDLPLLMVSKPRVKQEEEQGGEKAAA